MNTRIPSLKALRAFEAAARLGSMKHAADELCVTAGAVSRQIQALEEELGVMLFRRVTRGLRLTAAGRDYAARLTELLAGLRSATEGVRSRPGRSELRVLAPERFASLLVQILQGFEARHPQVHLAISTYQGLEGAAHLQADRAADVAILWGEGDWPGLVSHCLAPRPYLVPLCAPDYLGRQDPLEDPRDLARFPWLSNRYYPSAWARWLTCAGVPELRPRRVMELDNARLLVAAARSGLGIVMWSGSANLGDAPLGADGLVLAHPFHALAHPQTYYLACPGELDDDPVVEGFRDCVLQAFGVLD